ncbi:hypothetical protein RQP46_007344 [Phenoliferia psychrophenolica]
MNNIVESAVKLPGGLANNVFDLTGLLGVGGSVISGIFNIPQEVIGRIDTKIVPWEGPNAIIKSPPNGGQDHDNVKNLGGFLGVTGNIADPFQKGILGITRPIGGIIGKPLGAIIGTVADGVEGG